ncbi:FxsA family protein [Cellvibrio sp. UBA7661]|uniref:FxsA family protein n=1 Tax=Cellvibrio sp. UBA7661 TaxID=1946311 RepID=UPI002F358BA1
MRLPILPLLLLPFVELWLMIVIGSEIGALAVIAWLVGMIIVGLNLLRYLGASSMLRAAQGVRSGGAVPAQSLADGLFKAVGAVLLIIPGFISDVAAILCFIPWVRKWLLRRWLAKIAANSQAFGANPFASGVFRRTSGGYQEGNVYEHQGPANTKSDPAEEAILIDQRPESSPKDSPSTKR